MSRAPSQFDPMGMAEAFAGIRNDYAAARESRFRRRRDGLVQTGSSADYHFRNETDYLKVIEYARDMDRNDAIVGQMIDRAVLNTVQGGFSPDPQTGEEEVNALIYDRFCEWACDPQQCDSAGEMTFCDQQEQVLRSRFVDGDNFGLPRDDGTLQLIESHRCRSQFVNRAGPVGRFFGQSKLGPIDASVVLGVQMDEQRRRQAYWFTEDDLDPLSFAANTVESTPYPAFDGDGDPLVFHVYDPKRITQTRGVTAFAPVFDMMGMFEDVNFAKVVQQQIVSCIAFISTKDANFGGGTQGQMGSRRVETQSDGTERTTESMVPGIRIEGRKGEKLEGFSPQVPNPEFFDHVNLILKLIGANIGMPLVMMLMDASETNFSGWRGAVDQARMGFRRNQRWLREKFHERVYRWKVRNFIDESDVFGAAYKRLGDAIFRVKWTSPNWPYIQPLQDAQADAMRLEKRLTSPRRMHAERGQDVDEVTDEIIADNARAIRLALTEAKAISDEFAVPIEAARLLYLDTTQPLATFGSPQVNAVDPTVDPAADPNTETETAAMP